MRLGTESSAERTIKPRSPRSVVSASRQQAGRHTEVTMSLKLCLAALAVLMCAQSATSLQCYECNSNLDKTCMQDMPPEGLKKDCSEHPEGPKYTMCRKIVQHIDFEVNGLPPDHRVIRTCGWEDSNYKDRCYQRAGFGGRQEVCSCLTDYCNSAPRAAVPSLLAVAIMALVRNLLF